MNSVGLWVRRSRKYASPRVREGVSGPSLPLVALMVALFFAALVPNAAAAEGLPKITASPSSLSPRDTAVVMARVGAKNSCRLEVFSSGKEIKSRFEKAKTGLLEFTWSVPRTVAPGKSFMTVVCRGVDRLSRRSVTSLTSNKKGRSPVARKIRTLVVKSTAPPAITGLGAAGYPPYGSVMIPASGWFGGHGVNVMSNGSSGNLSGNWQCVELVNRFLTSEHFGPAIYGNAKDLYANAPGSSYERHPNGSGYVPVAGDIIVLGGGSYGHVVVVDAVVGSTVYAVEQNSSSTGRTAFTLSGSTLSRAYTMSVIGVIHAKANSRPPGSGGGGSGSGYHYQPYAADFNGDRRADIGLRDANTGKFFIKHGPNFDDQIDYQWAAGAHYQPYAADFNGDGRADIGIRDPNNGKFYIKYGTGAGDEVSYQWAVGSHYQPYAADFNGDGRADIGMRDPNNGKFYIKFGTGSADEISYQWALGAQYQPYAADFNGDGRADIGMRDSTTGIFFIKFGTGAGEEKSYPWAAGSQYQPFAADFNGDGIADIALRDATTGKIFIKHGPDFNDQVTYDWAAG